MSAAARTTYLVCIAGLIAAGIFVASFGPPSSISAPAPLGREATAIAAAQRAQPAFVENRGQWHPAARYVASFGATTLFVEEDGWSARFIERSDEQGERGAVVRMRFVGSRAPELEPERRLGRVANFFLGNDPALWHRGVPSYGAVRLCGVYDGVDVVAYGSGGHFEYDVVLAPHAALQPVEVQVEGAAGLRIDENGALVIETAAGPVRQARPKTWEVGEDGTRRSIECDYELRSTDRFGFVAPAWNGTSELVVDPGLEYSSFLGGSKDDTVEGLSVDQGIITIAGTTHSKNYPTTSGAYQTDIGRRNHPDVAVTRIDPSAVPSQQILSSTYLGGSNRDLAKGVWVAGTTVTVYGITSSLDFPTVSAFDQTQNGGRDLFVSQFDLTLGTLTYSTYLGGSATDGHLPPGVGELQDTGGLSVSPLGIVTITDYTFSSDFPWTPGAYDTERDPTGSADAIVCQLDPSQSVPANQLIYSTFLGGTSSEVPSAVHVDSAGIVTVTGITTFGDPNDFPTTPGAFNETFNGGTTIEFDRLRGDVFVSRLDPALTGSAQLVASTFLGGGFNEWGLAIDVDGAGNVWIAGYTSSDNFPTTPGAYSELNQGGPDAFVSKFDSGLTALLYSTMLGGSTVPPATTKEQELIHNLSVDGAGIVTIGGNTNSSDWPTTTGAYDPAWHGGDRDCFVARLDPALTGTAQLVYSTFLGGSFDEQIHGMHVDAAGDVTVVGDTNSSDFPTLNGFDSSLGGANDMFVAKLSIGPTAPPTPAILVAPISGLVTTEAGGSDTFDVVLATQPSFPVGIAISSSAPGEALVAAGAMGPAASIMLTFDGANWDQPQTVTASGVDDGVEDGDVAYTLDTLPATSTDPNYDTLDADDVAATNVDDDLATPSGLIADNPTATAIDLNWVDNSTTESSFEIEQSLSGAAPWNFVASVGANVVSYTDTGLSPDTTYYYRVRASKPGGDSAWSNIDSETTLQGAAVVDITGISPDTMDTGTSISVNIAGSGFAAGATVSLENGQGPTPNVSNVVVQSPILITATLSAGNGGPKGTRLWDVRVTNPNPNPSTDVLVDGFSVVK